MPLSLSVQNLVVKSREGRSLVTVPAFTATAGECIGIRGPSGAGKSTFLYALAGLQPLCEGTIVWGQEDFLKGGDEARARFRRENVGMIFQDFLLFEELSAEANAALPQAFARRSRRAPLARTAHAMLERLGLRDLDRPVETFSGGERQRVAISRALANDPSVLLADEPTASLDRTTADALISDLIDFARDEQKTLITISHDTHLLGRMDRVVTITDGRLAEETSRA